LFCGIGFRAADCVAADVPGAPVMAALPVAVPARFLPIIRVRLREQPAQPDFFVGGEQVVAVTPLDGIRRAVGHAHGQMVLPREGAAAVNTQERDIFRLHVGDVDGLAVRRHRNALRRNATGELETGWRQDPRCTRWRLVDAEHFDLVRVQLAHEEKVAPDGDLLRAAATDDLLSRRVIAEVDDLAGHREHRPIPLEVNVSEHETIRRRVEHIQLRANIVEGGRTRGIGHHRRVPQRRPIVPDDGAVGVLRQAVTGLGTVEQCVGLVT